MLTFISKGVVRDPSRSVFPVLVCFCGVFLSFVGICFIDGFMESFIDTTANFDTGHVKIVSRAYGDEMNARPIELSLKPGPGYLEELSKRYPGFSWTRRTLSGGIFDVPDENGETKAQSPAAIMAMDFLSRDSGTAADLGIPRALTAGTQILHGGEILISSRMAERLGVQVGQEVTIFSSTADGSSTSGNFRVCGFVSFGITQLDRGTVLMDISDSDYLLDMEEYAAEVLGFRNEGYDSSAIAAFRDEFNRSVEGTDPYRPRMFALEDQNNLRETVDITAMANAIITAIFVLLMTLVLWNAGLINGLRRYSEIGMRMAIGERRSHIVRTLLGEAFLSGLIGTVLAIACALPLTYYLQEVGVDYSEEFKNVTLMANSIMRAKLSVTAAVLAALPGLCSSLLGMYIACLGIYGRDTASLFKELET